MGVTAGQPLHLMLWYFTDNQEPALQIHKSFALLPVREAWAPHGVVPHEQYQAAYRRDDDGKGYTFEYRIPWETLNAKDTHPVAGDVVSATVQFLWGDAGGLENKGCAYDMMSKPGFPFQESGCWGKLIFAAQGDIPRSWVEPFQQPAPPEPLTFSYDLPADGETSVALFDKDHNIVRHIVAQAPRKAGHITETWDGRDCTGKLLPPGDYTWKGLYHAPLTTRYVMSIANSGQPAWKTADDTGGWGGDYGPPTAITVAGDRLIIGWMGHEAGWGIIATDLSGKKLWGLRQKNASLLASDGTRFFANGEGKNKEVNVYAVVNGQPLAFGNKRQSLLPPEGGGDNTPGGLAYDRGTLYVSYPMRNLIGVYDAASGELKTTWSVEKPGRLDAAHGAVLVISGNKIVRGVAGSFTDFAGRHLDAPAGIAVDAAGMVYVANQGALQNISVFNARGSYLRSIGKVGGRPVPGKYDPSGMRDPAGIAVDGEGKLWVPETALNMKRISVWDTKTGKLRKEFFGACSYAPFAWIDPEHPQEAFFDNTIWRIDLEKGTWYPKAIFYAQKSPNAVNAGNGSFYYPFRVFTARNKRQYAISQTLAFGPVMWLREGDRFRPIHYLFRNYANTDLFPEGPPFPIMGDKKAYPPGRVFVWSDANKDEEAQLNEIKEVPGDPPFFEWMDANLNLYADNVVYHPTAVSQDGVPAYDFAHPEKIIADRVGTSWTDAHATQFWSFRDDQALMKFTADGTREWTYPGLRHWRDVINVGTPGPGTLWGATCPVGPVGRYAGLLSYFGTVDLVRDDGLFVSQVFEHPAKGNNGPNIFYVEFFAGQLVQPKGSKKIYILAGDQDCRVSELLGLDTVKDLPGGIYHHTQAMADQAARAWAAYQSQVAGGQPLVIARGGIPGLADADPVGKSTDGKHAFQVQAAYDAENLYFHYRVASPAPLVNNIVDPFTIFRGGNLLDIQLATDLAAPAHVKPVAGEMRLLISRRDGKPWAVLLRPKVAGFTGQPITLTSGTGSEQFAAISAVDGITLRDYQASADGFSVTAVVPRALLGLAQLAPGSVLRMDIGYIYGNAGGTNATLRAYWHNNSFTANVVNDIPHESRLEPAEWGEARVE